MWFARTSFGWICYTAPMDTLFKKLGGMLSLALLAGLAQAETIEVTSDWILFPVKNGGAKMKLQVKDGAESLPPPKDIQLCSAAEADWWAPWNVRHLRGIEVISQDGLNLQPAAVVPDSANRRLSATFSEGVTDIDCRAYSLRSIHGAN